MYNLTDQRNAIAELQRYLLEISYATEGLPHLSIDGIYGDETRAVVTQFQARNGLTQSGEVDLATWQEIYRQFAAAREARVGAPLLLPPGSLPLALHASGNEVLLLQVLLNGMRETMPGIPPLHQSGHFDIETGRALRAYQGQCHLPTSGILDEESWARLTRDYQSRKCSRVHAK
ncbi:MAG: peptidoglycan-binding protein [Clostridia bacterium]|nr:peptidoglycan-binding protein [Clostridia bacterium]